MNWIFPKINGEHSEKVTINNLLSEIEEFKEEDDLERKAMEAMDILHSAETLVRQFFMRNQSLSAGEIKNKVIQKNDKRKYYT
jgi:hypothetical protein